MLLGEAGRRQVQAKLCRLLHTMVKLEVLAVGWWDCKDFLKVYEKKPNYAR